MFTKYDRRTIITTDIKTLTEMYSKEIGAKIFKTHIRSSVMVEEAQANQEDIFSYDQENNVSIDYKEFVEEYLKLESEGEI